MGLAQKLKEVDCVILIHPTYDIREDDPITSQSFSKYIKNLHKLTQVAKQKKIPIIAIPNRKTFAPYGEDINTLSPELISSWIILHEDAFYDTSLAMEKIRELTGKEIPQISASLGGMYISACVPSFGQDTFTKYKASKKEEFISPFVGSGRESLGKKATIIKEICR